MVTTIKNYIGLSTDSKPTTDTPPGSIFRELNTGQRWIWDGSNWIEDLELIYAFTEALKEVP